MKERRVYGCNGCDYTAPKRCDVVKHERACKKLKAVEAKACKKKEEQQDLSNSFRLTAKSPDDFARMVTEYVRKVRCPDFTMSFKGMWFDPMCVNTHSCPVGSVMNWEKSAIKPTGYPGLRGTVHYYLDKPTTKRSASNIIRNDLGFFSKESITISGINTGTGGSDGTGKCASYSVVLWLDDFPLIKKSINKILDLKARNSKYDAEVAKRSAEIDMAKHKALRDDNEMIALNAALEKRRKQLLTAVDAKFAGYIAKIPAALRYDADELEALIASMGVRYA